MKNIIFIGLLSSILFSFTEKIYVYSGWNLKGTSHDIKKMSEFADKDIVDQIIVYRDGGFVKGISSIGTIKESEGFWLYANKSGTLSFNTNGDSNDSGAGNPPSVSRNYYDSNCYGDHSWRDWATNWDNILDNCESNSNSNNSLKDIKFDLKKGWNLKGTSSSFRIRDILNKSCVTNDGIQIYSGSNFYKKDKDSSSYIIGDMGFWIHTSEDCTIQGSGSNPPSF